MPSDKSAQMQAVAEAVETLEESPLYAFRQKNHYHYVVGEGDLDARIMFIGEAPGENEAKQGRPFVGAAGKVLSEMLESIGLKREDVYITNIVKDRPPENRDPSAEELALYAPLLKRQIEIIQPKVIATLGRFSMDFVLDLLGVPEAGQKISNLHGKPLKAQADYGPVTVVPLYHPAASFYRQELRSQMQQDFQVLKQYMA